MNHIDFPHECRDWDFLYITPEDKEWGLCLCSIDEYCDINCLEYKEKAAPFLREPPN
jgi:hypothetical protein